MQLTDSGIQRAASALAERQSSPVAMERSGMVVRWSDLLAGLFSQVLVNVVYEQSKHITLTNILVLVAQILTDG